MVLVFVKGSGVAGRDAISSPRSPRTWDLNPRKVPWTVNTCPRDLCGSMMGLENINYCNCHCSKLQACYWARLVKMIGAGGSHEHQKAAEKRIGALQVIAIVAKHATHGLLISPALNACSRKCYGSASSTSVVDLSSTAAKWSSYNLRRQPRCVESIGQGDHGQTHCHR